MKCYFPVFLFGGKKTRVGFRTVSFPPYLSESGKIGFIQLDGYGCNMFQHHGRGVHFDFPVKKKGTFVLVLDCFRGWLSTQQRKAKHDIYIYIHTYIYRGLDFFLNF